MYINFEIYAAISLQIYEILSSQSSVRSEEFVGLQI